MKMRLMAVVAAVALVGCLCMFACSSGSSSSEEPSAQTDEATQTDDSQESDEASEDEATQTVDSDYVVEIGSANVTTDYSGNPVWIIEVSFTNNSDEETSFMLAIKDEAYQNGVELSGAYVVEGVDFSDSTKTIMPGATITFNLGYELDDISSDATLECSELMNQRKGLIASKTFSFNG